MTAARERTAAYRARKYAEGWHYINGRWTDAPRKQMAPGVAPPHGTTARYHSASFPCKCRECRDANAAYARERRQRLQFEGA